MKINDRAPYPFTDRTRPPGGRSKLMSFEILFPFGLWVFEPDWLLNHSQLV